MTLLADLAGSVVIVVGFPLAVLGVLDLFCWATGRRRIP